MSTEPEDALRILLKTTMATEAAAFPKHNLAKLSAVALILAFDCLQVTATTRA
jgi:hypothetical protein